MTSTYSIFATISLLHDYYGDSRTPDFDIIPTQATASALKGAGMLTKQVNNQLILLVKVKDSGALNLELPVDLKLSFYLELRNPAFINFTNVNYQPGNIFYFSNLPKTKLDSVLYLNNQIPLFNVADSYAIGDLVRDIAGDCFEVIKPVAAGTHPTADTAFWRKRSNKQYVHSGDQLALSDGILKVETAPAKNFEITVAKLNPITLAYNIPVGSKQYQSFTQDVSSIGVDLKDCNPGKFKVTVNGQEHYCYHDKTASYQRVFGVIEIFNLFGPANDFGFVDASNVPKSLDLELRFANRLALWKYITHSPAITGIEIPTVPNAFTAGVQPGVFISSAPMLINEQPLKTLQLMKGATIVATKLPNPPPDRISTHKDGDGNQYYCAEMYLNY